MLVPTDAIDPSKVDRRRQTFDIAAQNNWRSGKTCHAIYTVKDLLPAG